MAYNASMSLAIISASHYAGSGSASISLRAANLLKARLESDQPDRAVSVIDLRLFGVQSCVMCGDCASHPRCSRDVPFNDLLEVIRHQDELALIVPVYAGLPSRLVILMEKLQEMFWLRYSRNARTSEILRASRVGILAHGGQTEGFEEHYQASVIGPLSKCFHALGLAVLNDTAPGPICFGVSGYESSGGEQFPRSTHDMAAVGAAVDGLAELFRQAAMD